MGALITAQSAQYGAFVAQRHKADPKDVEHVDFVEGE
jgi:hypothetical protein